MKIKTKSQLNTLFSVVMVLVISAILLIANSHMKTTIEKKQVVDQLNRGLFELNIATHDYLLAESTRAMNQWQGRYASLQKLIRSEKFQSREEKGLLDQLKRNLEKLHSIFAKLTMTGPSGVKVSGELKERLLGHLLISSHAMLAIGRELTAICHRALLSFQRNSGFLIVLIILVIGVVIAVNSILLGRRIVRPIDKLRQGTRVVGEGNLDYPLATEDTDEIGDLSRAFDQMAKKLKTVMASRDDLEKNQLLLAEAEKLAQMGAWEWDILNDVWTMSHNWLVIHGCKDPHLSTSELLPIAYPEDREKVENAFSRATEHGEPYRIEHRIVRQDTGEVRYIKAYGDVKLDRSGKAVKLFGVAQDITERIQKEEERKTLEAQLFQSQKMESIGTLAGGIAHDFNNILGIILGNAELAMDDVPEWNPARQNLDEVKKACLRAKDVVRQILSFSRKSETKKKPLNMAPVVGESIKLLRASIPASIDIRGNISNHIKDILGDGTQIHQIMINLCTNAAQAMENDGGVIEISLRNLEVHEETVSLYPGLSSGPHVELRVNDTGDGINPEVIDRIFDPYFTTKDVGKGTGMGLAVVHGIVKSHDGIISIESETGKGARFQILFPAVQGQQRDEPQVSEELPTGNECILFVDDETSMVNLNQQRLERLGYEVIPHTDPSEALAFFRANPDQIDLVITDMTMPHMTGDKLAQGILEIRPDMPIILCTGYSERISEGSAEEIGFRKYIEKPIDKENLARSVREVLDG